MSDPTQLIVCGTCFRCCCCLSGRVEWWGSVPSVQRACQARVRRASTSAVRPLASGGAWDESIARQPSDHQPPIYPPRTALQSSSRPHQLHFTVTGTYLHLYRYAALRPLLYCPNFAHCNRCLVLVPACFDFGRQANTHTITTRLPPAPRTAPHRIASRRAFVAFTPP